MGEVKALDLRPEGGHLVCAAASYLVKRRKLVDELSLFEYGNEQLLRLEVFHRFAFPACGRIADLEGLCVVNDFVVHADVVCLGHAVFTLEEAIDLLEAGVCDLADVFADLDLGDDVSVVILDGAELVYSAEHGIGFCGYKSLADAEGVDLRALKQKLGYKTLVEGV